MFKAYLRKGESAKLKIENDNENNISNCCFINGNEYFEDAKAIKAKGVKMTPDDAIKAA